MSHEALLKKYLQLPDRLEAAIAGLSTADIQAILNDRQESGQ